MTFTKEVSLQPYNTFGIHQKAQLFAIFTHEAQLKEWITSGAFQSQEVTILGGGSNVLLLRNVPGIVLKNEIGGIEVVKESAEFWYVRVGAGVNWHAFVLHAIANQWAGIENLALIPGTIGAAPMQNIGAYGVELKDVFDSLEAVNLQTGKTEIFDAPTCKFGYRESIFKNEVKGKYVIVRVTFKLRKSPILNTSYGAIADTLAEMNAMPSIQSIAEAVIKIRQSKLPDPKVIGNAGSFFKNPTIAQDHFDVLHQKYPQMPFYALEGATYKIPAGWLIEQCGWKGHREGQVGVHAMQALVLVNYGDATGEEVYHLAQKIQASVHAKYQIHLQMEVNIIG